MEMIEGVTMKDYLLAIEKCAEEEKVVVLCKSLGEKIALLHDSSIVHGDLTTSNLMVRNESIVFIDFGLSYHSNNIEDKAVDLYVLERALSSTHPNTECLVCLRFFWLFYF